VFSIDVKTREVVEPLTKIIKETNSQARVCITSFNFGRTLQAARILNSNKISLCLYRIQAIPVMIYPYLVLRWLKSKGVTHLHIPHSCINSRLIETAHKNNIAIYAWSVNDQAKIGQLASMGVDGIISDEAELLQRTISEL